MLSGLRKYNSLSFLETMTPSNFSFPMPTKEAPTKVKKAGLRIQTDVGDKSKVDWRKPTANCPWEEINSAPGTKKEYGDADRHAMAMASSNWRAKAPLVPTIPESPKENGSLTTNSKAVPLHTIKSEQQKMNSFNGIADAINTNAYEVSVYDYGVAHLDEKLLQSSISTSGVIHALSLFELGHGDESHRPIAEIEQVGNNEGTRPRSFDELDTEEKLALKRLTKFGLAGEVVEDFFGRDDTKSDGRKNSDESETPDRLTEVDEKNRQATGQIPDEKQALQNFHAALRQIGVRFSGDGNGDVETTQMKAKDPAIVDIGRHVSENHSNQNHLVNIEQQGIDIMQHVRMLATKNLQSPSIIQADFLPSKALSIAQDKIDSDGPKIVGSKRLSHEPMDGGTATR